MPQEQARHAKPLTQTQSTLLHLRKHIEEAKQQLYTQDTPIQNQTIETTMSFVKLSERELEKQILLSDDVEHMVIAPIPYVSHYNRQPASITPFEWIIARSRGILMLVLLSTIAILQISKVWFHSFDEAGDALVEKIQWVCIGIVGLKLGYWLIRGGLKEFLNS